MTNPKEQEIRERFKTFLFENGYTNVPEIADWWLKELHSDREAVGEAVEKLSAYEHIIGDDKSDLLVWRKDVLSLLSPNK